MQRQATARESQLPAAAEADRDLLTATAAGDRAAFRRLHHRYRPRVFRFALRLLARADIADEVAGDTMLAIWCSAAGYRGEGRPSNWIFGIAYRLAMKAGRRLAREGLMDEIDDNLAADSTDIRGVPAAFLKENVAAALRRLPVEQRATIELTYFYGYRLSEIAEITGCPPGTVKSRMFHARTKLRSLLEGER